MNARAEAPTTLLLTTSYPRSEDDFGGHFVRTHARAERASARSVRVLAFGTRPEGEARARATRRNRADVEHDADIEVQWLGGGALFGAPGVLVRLAESRTRVLLLAGPLLRALWALRHRARYDRVVAHFLLLTGWPLGAWFSRRAAPLGPSALEIVAHGSDVRLFERLPAWLRRRIVRDLRAQRATIRFVSAELRGRMTAAAGSPEFSEYVQAQPVQALPLEMPNLPARAAARSLLGIMDSETVVVTVGRLTEGKRVEVALGAAQLMAEARVIVIGDGPQRAALVRAYPDVQFLGALERELTLTWILASDLLVSASRLEGAPTAVREARMLGVPVVATKAGDLELWSSRDDELWLVD